jgi:hypothetical protein
VIERGDALIGVEIKATRRLGAPAASPRAFRDECRRGPGSTLSHGGERFILAVYPNAGSSGADTSTSARLILVQNFWGSGACWASVRTHLNPCPIAS